jgi:hypothetical protein
VTKPKVKMLKMKTSNGRRPQNIKSGISQLPQILNLSSGEQTKIKNAERPTIEDNLKILIVEYLSNHLSDLPQILHLS